MLTRKSTASLLTLAEGEEAACHEILHAYAYCKISRGNTRSSLTKKLGVVKERVDATGWGTPLHRAFRQINDTLDNARTSWGGKGVEGQLAELQRAKTAHGQRAWAAACGNQKKYAKALAKMDADSYAPRPVGVLYESSPVEADPQVWQPRVKEENPMEHTRRARSHGNLRAQPPPDDVPMMPPPPMGRMRAGSQSSVALSDPCVVASGSGRARVYALDSAAASQASLGRASATGESSPYPIQRMLDDAPPMPQRTDSPSPRGRGQTPRPYAQERPPSPRLAPSRHQHTPSQTSVRRPQRSQTVDADMYMQASERPRHQHSPSQTSISSNVMPRPQRAQTFDQGMQDAYMPAPERPRHQHTPSQSSIDSINRMRPQRSQTFDQHQPPQDMYMPAPERPRHQHSASQSSNNGRDMPRPQRSQTVDSEMYMQTPERPRHQHSASQSSTGAGMPRPQRSQTFDRPQGVQLVDRPVQHSRNPSQNSLPRAQTFDHNQQCAYTQPRAVPVPGHKHSASQGSFQRF